MPPVHLFKMLSRIPLYEPSQSISTLLLIDVSFSISFSYYKYYRDVFAYAVLCTWVRAVGLCGTGIFNFNAHCQTVLQNGTKCSMLVMPTRYLTVVIASTLSITKLKIFANVMDSFSLF